MSARGKWLIYNTYSRYVAPHKKRLTFLRDFLFVQCSNECAEGFVTTRTTTSKTPAKKPVAKVAASAVAAPKAVATPVAVKPAKPAPTAVVATPVVAEWPVAEQPAAPAAETPAVETKPTAALVTEMLAKAKEFSVNDTIKDAAEKGQAYFAELTAKAKTAAEKGTKAVEEFNDFSKGNVEALVESGKIAAKGFETLGQGYAEYARKSFETTTAAFKGFAAVKSPTDFFKLHSDYVRGQFDSVVAETSKNTEALLKLAGEVAQPISNRVSLAAEKMKIAA
jgi:phasin family protein